MMMRQRLTGVTTMVEYVDLLDLVVHATESRKPAPPVRFATKLPSLAMPKAPPLPRPKPLPGPDPLPTAPPLPVAPTLELKPPAPRPRAKPRAWGAKATWPKRSKKKKKSMTLYRDWPRGPRRVLRLCPICRRRDCGLTRWIEI
jgi:hypothetical protein